MGYEMPTLRKQTRLISFHSQGCNRRIGVHKASHSALALFHG
jgi:hypothetical protein